MSEKNYYDNLQLSDVVGAKNFITCLIKQLGDQQQESLAKFDVESAQMSLFIQTFLQESLNTLDMALSGFRTDVEFYNIMAREALLDGEN